MKFDKYLVLLVAIFSCSYFIAAGDIGQLKLLSVYSAFITLIYIIFKEVGWVD